MKKTGMKTWEAETTLKDIRILYHVKENGQGALESVSASVFRGETNEFLGTMSMMDDEGVNMIFAPGTNTSEKKMLFDTFFKDLDDIKKGK